MRAPNDWAICRMAQTMAAGLRARADEDDWVDPDMGDRDRRRLGRSSGATQPRMRQKIASRSVGVREPR